MNAAEMFNDAKAAENAGDIEKAKGLYKRVIGEHSGSPEAKEAGRCLAGKASGVTTVDIGSSKVSENSSGGGATLLHFDAYFIDMVTHMIKLGVAAIPATVILAVIWGIVSALVISAIA